MQNINTNNEKTKACHCIICNYTPEHPSEKDFGTVRGNTTLFQKSAFRIWKCPKCLTIHALDPGDLKEIYSNYSLNKRKLDNYASRTYKNLLKRLIQSGIKKSDYILDYGCGNGVFIKFMKKNGYKNILGYDPYVSDYSTPPVMNCDFDWVIANDVIEHCQNPRKMIQETLSFLKQKGKLYVGTADSQNIEMNDIDKYITALHLPFHRVIINQATLLSLGVEFQLEPEHIYLRSYMDTLFPFSNYKFLDEYSKALGHNIDKALDPSNATIIFKKPQLLFYAFLGYFFSSSNEPAVIWIKPD